MIGVKTIPITTATPHDSPLWRRGCSTTAFEHGREYEFIDQDPRDALSGYLVYRADFNGSEVLPVVTDGAN